MHTVGRAGEEDRVGCTGEWDGDRMRRRARSREMGEAERREEKTRRCKPDTVRGGLVDEKKPTERLPSLIL
jgi:hypothetical protein